MSGGERRRVSIGVELIHDPGVIFLDEPTSGLDSTSALHVVEILSMLAVERNRLVILTIHQPSFRILDLLNKVLILARGNVVYHGRVEAMTKFFEGLGQRIPANVSFKSPIDLDRLLFDPRYSELSDLGLMGRPNVHVAGQCCRVRPRYNRASPGRS